MSGTNRFVVHACRRSAGAGGDETECRRELYPLTLLLDWQGEAERPRSSFGPPLTVLELNGSAEEWRVFATPLLRTEGLRTSGPAL